MIGKKPLFVWCFLFFSVVLNIHCQVTVKGELTDVFNNAVPDASVILSNQQGDILNFTYSDTSGKFLINLREVNSATTGFTITVNAIGFANQSNSVQIETGKDSYSFTFELEVEVEQLNEVVLKPDEKISSNGNVTTIKTASFVNNFEQTVEDVLKKLPGIEVLSDGTIKAHGKHIKKLMIDGDDLFGNEYQIVTKNLDAKALDAVQVINNYQDNPVLAKVMNSDDVALNLEIKDTFKNIWFGNATLGLGSKNRERASINLGLLKKKIKFFYLGDYNNLGNKAASQLTGNPTSYNLSSAYQEEKIEPVINPIFSIHKNENRVLKADQNIFNKAFMNSLGLATKLHPNFELRAKGSFARDNQEQLFFSKSTFIVEENPIEYKENSQTKHRNIIGAGDLELKYTGGEKSYLKNEFTYYNQPEKYANQIIFNTTDVAQNLSKKEYSYYNHLNYSYVLGRSNVLHNYIYIGETEVSQDVAIKSPVLNDFFSQAEDSETQQYSKDQLSVFGVKSNLFSKFGKFTNRFMLGYESIKENRMVEAFSKSAEAYTELESFENEVQFNVKTFNLETNLSYTFSKKARLSIGLALQNLNLSALLDKQDIWVFNPKIDLDLRELKIGQFLFRYKKDHALPKSYLLFENNQLSSYNSFIKGAVSRRLIDKENYVFTYRWANELESQSVSLRLSYDTYEGDYASVDQIEENLKFGSYQFIDGSNHLSSSLSYLMFFDALNFSANLSTSHNWATQPLMANAIEFKDLKTYSSSYLFSGTTYFRMPLNFKVHANLFFSESEYNMMFSKTRWSNYTLDLSYRISYEWFMEVSQDFYNMSSSSYYFLNANLSYQPDASNFSYILMLRNLANEKNFKNISIDNYTVYESHTKVLPRYIFASIMYRF